MSNGLRITGMGSGLDVDTLVKQMMKAESMKVDRVKQDRQTIQWKQDLFRDIIGDLNNFKKSYFDVLKSDTYMLSSNNFSAFDVGYDVTGQLTATAGANAVSGVYTVNTQKLAEKATQSGSFIKVKQAENSVSFPVTLTKNSISVSIDDGSGAKNYNVNLAVGDYKSLNDLATHINTQLSKAIDTSDNTTQANLTSKVYASVSEDGTKLIFTNSSPATNTINLDGNSVTNTPIELNGLQFDIQVKSGVNDALMVNVDGVNYKLNLRQNTYKLNDPDPTHDLVAELNYALANAVQLKADGTPEAANPTDISSKLEAALSFDGTRLKLTNKTAGAGAINISGNATKLLGYASNNVSINPASTDKMSSIFGGKVSFNVNGVDFNYDFSDAAKDKNKTIQNIMDDISTKAGVKVSYSELGRKFTISSASTGSDQQLNINWQPGVAGTDSDAFMSNLFGISTGNSTAGTLPDTKYYFSKAGADAKVTITDPKGSSATLIKSSNTFAVDGVSYNLLQASGTDVKVTLTSNSQKVFDKIKGFIDKYNEIIDKINTKIDEKKNYSYKPLTDDQKSSMKDDEIKAWEDKAKQGLLKNDNQLESMLTQMRTAFYDTVKPVYSDDPSDTSSIGIQLKDIGLSTSSDVTERGKIVIDEFKLKNAIEQNGDKVAQLFMKSSSTKPYYNPDMTSTDRTHRYQESGIFQRINDILQDNIRTTRNIDGKKGFLIEKAGIQGDFSEFNNLLYTQLKQKDDLISQMNQKMADKENKLYLQFSKLDTSMQKLNEQSNWLSSQLGSMSKSQ